METLKCSPSLWTALGLKGRVAKREPPCTGGRLGGWALKLHRSDGRPLIIALNETTYLTLVFPGEPRSSLRDRFGAALHDALVDLGIDSRIASVEVDGIRVLPFAPLRHPELTQSLGFIQLICDCELDYTADLRRVQRNLNDLPHPVRSPCVPAEAVRLFFAVGPRGPRAGVH
jgi:hypothetical protein